LISAPIGPNGALGVFKAAIAKITPKQLKTLPTAPLIHRLKSNSTSPVVKLIIPAI
jgi:hypothetical protein